MRTVKLQGNDITKYILSIPSIVNSTSEYGQITSVDMPVLIGDNRHRFFDTDNPASPFFGALTLSNYLFEITDNGITVFSGNIDTLEANNETKQANITLKSTIQKKLEKGLIYASSSDSNPAEMAREICELYKIDINSDSFNRSSNIYNDNSVVTTAFFRGEGTLLDGLQQIAEIGCARVYVSSGLINFEVFETKEALPVATFTDNFNNIGYHPLYSRPKTQNIQKEPITGYKVEWTGGFPAVFGDSEEQGKTITANKGSTVRIETLQSAVWIGEKWLEYFNTPQNMINFRISNHLGRSLGVNYPVQINYKGKSVIVDINSIDNSNIVYSDIWGQTR